jgi:hypothetical protein
LRELETRWTFQARDDGGCDVGFHLSYELASRTLALLMGTVFDAAFSRFAVAFQRRADIVYGRPPLAAARAEREQRDRHSPPLGRRQHDRRKTASLGSTMQRGKRRLA